MYVRFNIDKNGNTKLQQLLEFDYNDGKGKQPIWENVPTTGLGLSQTFDTPITTTAGIFIIKDDYTTHVLSALSIEKIIEVSENKIRVDTHDKKKFFYFNISQYEFILLMTKMLNKFIITNVDSNGNIETNKRREHGKKTKTKVNLQQKGDTGEERSDSHKN